MAKDRKISPGSAERVRKIAEHQDTIRIDLLPSEVGEEREAVCELLTRQENLVAALKATKAEYKVKIDAVKAKISASLAAAATETRDLNVTVEEWLTRGNEIVSIRADTGEMLGTRTATVSELQESLFPPPVKPAVAKAEGFPSSDEAFGNDAS